MKAKADCIKRSSRKRSITTTPPPVFPSPLFLALAPDSRPLFLCPSQQTGLSSGWLCVDCQTSKRWRWRWNVAGGARSVSLTGR
eukprot:gene637-354_t